MPASCFRHAAFVALAASIPVRGWAQALTDPTSIGSGRAGSGYTFGRLHLYPRVLLRNAGVSTNVYNAQAGAIPDSSIILSPVLQGQMPIGRRFRLQGQGGLDFTWFGRQTSERSTDYFGKANLEADVGPLTLSVGGGGGQYRQRFSIDIDERLLRQEKAAEAGAAWHVTRRISLTGTVRGAEYRFEPGVMVAGSDVARTLDRDTRSLDGSLSYRLTNQTSLVGSVNLTEDRFLGETQLGRRITQSRGYFAGFDFGRKALLTGRVRAGVREYPVSSAGGAPPYRGPAFGVDVAIPVQRFGQVTLVAGRDVVYAVGRGASAEGLLRNSYVSSRYTGTLTVGLPFDLLGSATAGFERAQYLLPLVSAGSLLERVDHLWIAGGSLMRRFGDHVRLGAGATVVRRVSNLRDSSYQNLTYGLTGEFVP